MANKLLLVVIFADVLILASGILLLAFAVVTQNELTRDASSGEEAVEGLVDERLPLTAGIVNAVFILIAFFSSIPGLMMPTTRGWLKLTGYLVAFCALFTMVLGLDLWIMTLRIGENFTTVYTELEPEIQGMVQISFQCCGYANSSSPPFVMNEICPSPAAAMLLNGCQSSVSAFANGKLDKVFTAVFGVVGIDALFILALACLSKDRKDRMGYRGINEKAGRW